MWIRDYRGELHNMNTFAAVRTGQTNNVRYVLYGVPTNGRKPVDLLAYVSLSGLGFEHRAMDAINNGLKRNAQLVDLRGICKKYNYID